MKVVGRLCPFHITGEFAAKPVPSTVRVKGELLTGIIAGESCVTVGTALKRLPVMVVLALAWLLESVGSKLTDAVFAVIVRVPAVVGVIEMVTVAELPLAMVPKSQSSTVPPLQVPCDGVTVALVEAAGRTVLRVAPCAVFCPRFATCTV